MQVFVSTPITKCICFFSGLLYALGTPDLLCCERPCATSNLQKLVSLQHAVVRWGRPRQHGALVLSSTAFSCSLKRARTRKEGGVLHAM